MIRFVVGLPGAGKSLYAVTQLVEELRRTERHIVTNLALRLDPWVDGRGKARRGLLRTLVDTFGQEFDARTRIHFIGLEETGEFFLYGRTQVPDAYRGANGKFSLQLDSRGVAYFIDELHEFFPSKDWAKHSDLTLSWATQHRRAGDDAWLITQHPMLVANQFRRLSQECVSLQNRKFRRFAVWRQPDMLSFSVYQSTPPGDAEPAMHSDWIRGGRERAYECYDTAAGVGVSGTVADVATRPTGLPFWTLAPAVMVVLLLCLFLLAGCTHIVSYVLKRELPKVPAGQVSAAVQRPPAAIVPAMITAPPVTNLPVAPVPVVPVPVVVRGTNVCAGVMESGGRFWALWSDGISTELREKPVYVGREVLLDGVVYPVKAPGTGKKGAGAG